MRAASELDRVEAPPIASVAWRTIGSPSNPGDPNAQSFPQFGHGSIKLTVLFNDPTNKE